MTDQLKRLLNDMADEAKPASLHSDAARQSKRTSARHTVVAAVAALLVLGGGVVGFNSLAAAGSSETTAAPASEPTPQTSERPPVDYPEAELDGVFYDSIFEQGKSQSIHSWSDAEPKPTEVVTGDASQWYYQSGAISSDGRYLAWLTYDESDSDTGTAVGRIMVRDLTDDNEHELTEYRAVDGVCSFPSWSPDGRLFVDHGTVAEERYGFYDPSNGEFTPSAAPQGCDVQVAQDDDGSDLFISLVSLGGGEHDITVTTADGHTTTSPARETLADVHGFINNLTAVSPDGRYACLRVGDVRDSYFPDRMPLCEYIVQIDTGALIMVTDTLADDQEASGSPNGIGNLAALSVPGHVLVYDGESMVYKLADLDGQVVDTVAPDYTDVDSEPQLIEYVPGS